MTAEERQVVIEALDLYIALGSGDFDAISRLFVRDGRFDDRGRVHVRRELASLKLKTLGLTPSIGQSVSSPKVPERYAVADRIRQSLRQED